MPLGGAWILVELRNRSDGPPVKRHSLVYSSTMKTVRLTLPEIALLAGTRAALGAGVGLLLGEKLNPNSGRQWVGRFSPLVCSRPSHWRSRCSANASRATSRFLPVGRIQPSRWAHAGNSICTLTLSAGMLEAKSNASIDSSKPNRSVISGFTSILPAPISAKARGKTCA